MDYYKKKIEDIYVELDTNQNGLNTLQVNQRLKYYGHNELKTETKVSALKIFLNQFKSFIVYILFFAVLISFLLGHVMDAILIVIILLANSTIGFFQEYSAQKSLEALKRMDLTRAKVYREGHMIDVESKFLVPGDIIYLEAGDKVPADCRIFEERVLKIDESALTGESIPVKKHSFVIEQSAVISDQKNIVFAGTTVTEGSGRAVVVFTAMKTEIGKITKLIADAHEEITPLQKKLDSFGKNISLIIIGICLFVFFILILTKGFSSENLLIFGLVAISLAVAAVPTALPAVVTIALSVGVKRLLKKKVIVRKLSAVETLGSCDVICTDKTGTLTKNEMTVRNVWTFDGDAEVEGIGYVPTGHISKKLDSIVFKIGQICNNASLYKKNNLWKISGDPTEAALIVSAKKAEVNAEFQKIDEIPFDSTRKMMSVFVKEKEKYFVYTKGSTTHVLSKCTHILVSGKVVKLTSEMKDKIHLQNDVYSSEALRVLAFAYKEIKTKSEFKEEGLIFVGLQAMIDPPRVEVIDAISRAKEAKIRVIMITGDYKETAKAIGDKIGITGNVLTGEDLMKMSDSQLDLALKNNTNIFARVIPEHKQRIVTILQKQGSIVAMTGDGVNDAPALKKANIGVAMASGTDVAKEASDIVLLDDSFAHIVSAIEEGRGIYDNIQKSIMLLLSGNFAEVLIIFIAVIVGFNLPLTAILLLWINLLTDGAPALAYAVDPYGKNIMKRAPARSTENILPKMKFYLILVLGIISTMIGLFLFNIYGGNSFNETSLQYMYAQTVIFNFIVLYEMILVFIIRHQYDINQFSNSWLWGSVLFTLILQAVIMYGPANTLFGLVPLDIFDLSIIAIEGVMFVLCYFIYCTIINKKGNLFSN